MKIYLVRHANAVPDGPGLIDEHRFLSGKGRQVALAVGGRLAEEGVELDAVLTSPLVRAVQTAELVARAVGFQGEVQTLAALAPGFPPSVAGQRLVTLGQAVLAVGHAPGISDVGAFFVARPSFPSFKPGQVCMIDQGKPGWTLSPDTLAIEQLLVA